MRNVLTSFEQFYTHLWLKKGLTVYLWRSNKGLIASLKQGKKCKFILRPIKF